MKNRAFFGFAFELAVLWLCTFIIPTSSQGTYHWTCLDGSPHNIFVPGCWDNGGSMIPSGSDVVFEALSGLSPHIDINDEITFDDMSFRNIYPPQRVRISLGASLSCNSITVTNSVGLAFIACGYSSIGSSSMTVGSLSDVELKSLTLLSSLSVSGKSVLRVSKRFLNVTGSASFDNCVIFLEFDHPQYVEDSEFDSINVNNLVIGENVDIFLVPFYDGTMLDQMLVRNHTLFRFNNITGHFRYATVLGMPWDAQINYTSDNIFVWFHDINDVPTNFVADRDSFVVGDSEDWKNKLIDFGGSGYASYIIIALVMAILTVLVCIGCLFCVTTKCCLVNIGLSKVIIRLIKTVYSRYIRPYSQQYAHEKQIDEDEEDEEYTDGAAYWAADDIVS